MLKFNNADILISDIVRPFSIKLMQLELLHTNFSLNPKETNVYLQIKVNNYRVINSRCNYFVVQKRLVSRDIFYTMVK